MRGLHPSKPTIGCKDSKQKCTLYSSPAEPHSLAGPTLGMLGHLCQPAVGQDRLTQACFITER